MEKKNLIIILSGIILILLIASIYFYSSQKIEIVVMQPEKIEDCSGINGNYIRDACYIQIASKEMNETICNNIVNSNQKDICFTEMAKIKNDRTICEFILDTKYARTKCYGEMNILAQQ
jgi:hypothetical protein